MLLLRMMVSVEPENLAEHYASESEKHYSLAARYTDRAERGFFARRINVVRDIYINLANVNAQWGRHFELEAEKATAGQVSAQRQGGAVILQYVAPGQQK
jgi:hypothetical protein